MIPQRNISLLSNRLAAGGRVRIREDILERDYCLAWLLCAFAQSDLQPVLAFKGGTALKRCYFADYRFSEDLDFTLREALPFEAIRARLERVYRIVQEQSGIVFTFDRQDPRVRANTHTFYLRCFADTRSSPTFQKTGPFSSTRSTKLPPKKRSRSPIQLETSRETSTICGI